MCVQIINKLQTNNLDNINKQQTNNLDNVNKQQTNIYSTHADISRLQKAITNGYTLIIKQLLIDNRISLYWVDDSNGFSLLFYCVQFHYNSLVDFILERRKEDFLEVDLEGNSLLMVCVLFNNRDVSIF